MAPLTGRLDRSGLYSQILCTFSAADFSAKIAYFDDGNRSLMPSFPFTKISPTGAKGRGRMAQKQSGRLINRFLKIR
jgi:hypothetical protein